jgi:hypothetical protein
MISLKRVSAPNHLQNSSIFSDEFWCRSVEYLPMPNRIRGLSHDGGVACVENHLMMNHGLRSLRMGLMIDDGDVWFSLMLGWILCQLIGVVILVLGVEPLMVFLLE